MAFGVAFRADVACRGKICLHLSERLASLALEPPRLLGRNDTAFAWPTALALRRIFRFLAPRRLLAGRNRCRITRDMPDKLILERSCDQGCVHALGQATAGEPGKRARERRLAGDSGGALPTAQPAQRGVDVQPFDQHVGGRQIEHRFGDERPGERVAVTGRTPRLAVAHRKVALDAHHFQHRDQPLVIIRERSDLRLQPRKKMRLNVPPTRCYLLDQRHVPSDSSGGFSHKHHARLGPGRLVSSPPGR